MGGPKCPACRRSLDSHKAVRGEPALVSFVDGVAIHSGVCEARALQKPGSKITDFVKEPCVA